MQPRSRRHRWLAAASLAAFATCFLAATGLFAPCHQGELPMSCCPDSSQAQTAGPQAALIAPTILTAQLEVPQPVVAVARPAAAALPVLAHQREVYLRLSTLLI